MAKLFIRRYTYNKIIDICNIPLLRKKDYSDDIFITIECKNSLNTNENKYISHNTDGEFFVKDITKPDDENNKIKLGKILQQLIKEDLTPEKIEEHINLWKKAYTIDTSIVKVSDDISMVYDISNCGGSCMAHKGHFMDIYKHFGCSVAYIEEDGSLKARAILWNNISFKDKDINEEEVLKGSFIDRIFYEKEEYKLTLQKWAKENSYETMDKNDFIYLTDEKPLEYFSDGVPYIDTLRNLFYSDDHIQLSSGDYNTIDTDKFIVLEQTNGTDGHSYYFGIEEPGIWVEDLQEYVSEDCAVYLENCDHYVSEDYMFLAYIEEWSMYVDVEWEDGDVVWLEDESRYAPTENAYYVEDKDYYVGSTGNIYYCEDDDCYYEELDAICYTEDDETYRLKDNCYCVAETNEWYHNESDFEYRLKELNNEKL